MKHTTTQIECHQVETCITSSINAINKEKIIATNIVVEDAEIMEFKWKDVKRETPNSFIPILKDNCYGENTKEQMLINTKVLHPYFEI